MKTNRLEIYGLVQGIGFRPFLYRLCAEFGLCANISNTSFGVEVVVNISEDILQKFLQALHEKAPPMSRIDRLVVSEIDFVHLDKIQINKSKKTSDIQSLILPDLAICKACKDELLDPNNRRFGYPFINCTNCGPRQSIIADLPYDRPNTSMRVFDMCELCKKEYEDINDRRYHAQPISCKNCGPSLFVGGKKHADAISITAQAIKDGKIVALKGLSGFHLMCDASNTATIERLRKSKNRPHKPFAIMCLDLEMAKTVAAINETEQEYLVSDAYPIVIVQKRPSSLSPLVAPDLNRLGIFLAPSALHILLLQKLNFPIIATSANISGEPIIYTTKDCDKLSHIVDLVVDNDREIYQPSDDSIMQVCLDRAIFLRTSRSLRPYVLKTKHNINKCVLAVGAHQKNTIAIYNKGLIHLSVYIGDLGTYASEQRFTQTIDFFAKLYNMRFDVVVCDKHSNYQSSIYAKSLGIECCEVYHHHAHAVSVMSEQDINHKVLALAWDGTGLGDDGSLWGGEFLSCDKTSFERLSYLAPIKLLSGENAIFDIYKLALSFAIFSNKASLLDKFNDFSTNEIHNLKLLHERDLTLSSSVGRLFDVVAFFILGVKSISFEGMSGLLIEARANEFCDDVYEMDFDKKIIEFYDVLEQMLLDPIDIALAKFINTLSILAIKKSKIYALDLVLCGGVFQNKLLVSRILKDAKTHGVRVFTPQILSPNDEAIALGQLEIYLNNKEKQ